MKNPVLQDATRDDGGSGDDMTDAIHAFFYNKHQRFKHRKPEIWPTFLCKISVPLILLSICLCVLSPRGILST